MAKQKIYRPSSRVVSHACVCHPVFDCCRPKLRDYPQETEIQIEFVRAVNCDFPILCGRAFAKRLSRSLVLKRPRTNLFSMSLDSLFSAK